MPGGSFAHLCVGGGWLLQGRVGTGDSRLMVANEASSVVLHKQPLSSALCRL